MRKVKVIVAYIMIIGRFVVFLSSRESMDQIDEGVDVVSTPILSELPVVAPVDTARIDEVIVPTASPVVLEGYDEGYEFCPIVKGAFLDAFFVNETRGKQNYAIGETYWRKDMASFDENGLRLDLTQDSSGEGGWFGAEVVTEFETGYGYYEAELRTYGGGPGVVTSFFIYNHTNVDEIDVEFSSRKPHLVELCYHAKGESSGGKESSAFIVDLGFDSSADFHKYGFLYGPDVIIWYVDGEEVHRTSYEHTKEKVTSSCATIFNLWAGGDEFMNWLGETVVPDEGEMTASVRNVKFVPIGEYESGMEG